MSATAPGDTSGGTYEQTVDAFERALAAVEELGGTKDDVIRTRLYLDPAADWERAADAHRDVFGGVDPANATFYVHGFIPEGVLVEVELDAVTS